MIMQVKLYRHTHIQNHTLIKLEQYSGVYFMRGIQGI